MAIDLFSTRTMLPMLDESKPAHSFLKNRYFADERRFETEKVDIDIYIGKRRVAPFVHPKIGGKTVERDGYRTDSFEPPEVSPDMVTTADKMLKRSPGETIYGAGSPQERAAQQVGRDLAELDDMITRREEVMSSEALFQGQVTVKGDGYDEVLRYWPSTPSEQPYLDLGAGNYWNEAGSDPQLNFRNAKRDCVQKSGVQARDALMGTSALDSFLSNTTLKGNLDNRRIDTGEIDPQMLPDGVTYWGYDKTSGLDIWTYEEWYIDPETGLELPMVPEKKVLIGSPNARTTMMYGCVTLMKGDDNNPEFYALPRVPDSWTQRKNPAGRIVQLKSKPLPVVHQIYGFKVLEVLA